MWISIHIQHHPISSIHIHPHPSFLHHCWRCWRRPASSVKKSTICRRVSFPLALHLHWADSTLGTLLLYGNFASPIRHVRACTSTELSAFLSPEWSLSTALFGGISSGIALLPRSAPGRATLSTIFGYFFHLAVQSSSTFRFSHSFHYSIGCPIHFSTHSFRVVASVLLAC